MAMLMCNTDATGRDPSFMDVPQMHVLSRFNICLMTLKVLSVTLYNKVH